MYHQSVDQELHEKQRDALVTFYLKQLIPKDSKFQHYRDSIETANDLYGFLLIDNQVSSQVNSNPIAEAMASLQLYINRVMLNLESGISADKEEIENWQTINRNYALWAANQRLAFYPENFIDPILRQHKTPLFKTLESNLSQGRINEDSVQQAILNYLNEFESISNLKLVNAYQDGSNASQDRFYFIASTRTQPFTYFWRQLDMQQKNPENNVLYPSAWSSWQEIKIGLAQAINQNVNLVFFNGRLHIIWVEQQQEQKGQEKTNLWLLKLAFKKFDDTWSSPQSYPLILSWEPSDIGTLRSYATVDQRSTAAQKILICLYDDNDFDAINEQWTIDELLTKKLLLTTEKFLVKLSTTKDIPIFRPFQSKFENTLKAYITSNEHAQFLGFFTEHFSFDDPKKITFTNKLNYNCKYSEFETEDDYLYFYFLIFLENLESPFEEKNLFFTTISKKQFSEENFTTQYKYADSQVKKMNLSKPNADTYFNRKVKVEDKYVKCRLSLKWDGVSHTDFFLVLWHNNIKSGHGNTPIAYSRIKGTSITYTKIPTYTVPFDYALNCKASSKQLNITFSFQSLAEPFKKENIFFGLVKKDKITTSQGNWQWLENISLSKGQTEFLNDSESSKLEKFVLNFKQVDLSNYVLAVIYDTKKNKSSSEKYFYILSTHTITKTAKFTEKKIRLNTLFAKELVQRANCNLAAIFHRGTQALTEPAAEPGKQPVPMDFEGANGLYFWELFFHVPFLISHRLNQEQRYPEAMVWMNYLFNPQDDQDYWQVRPLTQQPVPAHAYMAPTDPDALAASDPIRYKKAVFLQFIQLLQNYGDAYYRRLTRDDLNTAKLFYVLALKLLGPRPDLSMFSTQAGLFQLGKISLPTTARMDTHFFAEKHSPSSDAETEITEFVDESSNLETTAGTSATFQEAPEPEASENELIFDLPMQANPVLASAVNQAPFCRPYNQALLDRWDQIEMRLKYLRHGLSLEGKAITLPLFATPLNPRELQTQLASRSAQGVPMLSNLVAVTPPYRFHILLHKANVAVDHLIQLGQQLLSSLERKDNLVLEERQYSQQAELLALTDEMQELSIFLAENNEKALQASYQTAQARQRHYQALCDEAISNAEQQAIDLRIAGSTLYAGTSALRMAGAIANLAPNTFGMAVGGSRWGAPLDAAAWAVQAAAETTTQTGHIIETKEQYRRRKQEWELQQKQAGFEMEQIQIQRRSEQLQLEIAKAQRQQTQKQQQHIADLYEFLQTRFTQKELYHWMIQQLSRLYRQAYDQVMSFCLSAQAAWQYEVGDFETRFMPTHAWEDRYQGLFAGEHLKLSLQRMDQRYLLSRERAFELIKVVSLKQHFGYDWEKIYQHLQATGLCTFVLNQKDYDQDYPGHYLRRIKTMALSFPALLGPYQQVRAVLTQTSNALVYKPNIAAVTYLYTQQGNSPSDIKMNLRANQQIALSTGIDDTGLFSLNFDDERYLPFEGTGAVSSWELKFPNAQHPQQQQLLKSLTDVIVHIRYTAKDGGLDFSQKVEKALTVKA
jgi:hypothetical protein